VTWGRCTAESSRPMSRIGPDAQVLDERQLVFERQVISPGPE